ncbi:tetratricopeptide repeat protein [Lapillicoccus sp.]|uniref:tetratricopeptide repeat protein n=1 Tax=Lapillicoccus sp. TaxID=1909287 RepID=UPI003983C422
MSQQPLTPSALRGAVDLSALKRPSGSPTAGGPPSAGSASGAGSAPAGSTAPVVTATDANFQEVANSSMRVPAIIVLWSSRLADSENFVKIMTGVAATNEGRFQLVSVNVDENPGLLRAFQVQSVPVTLGLVQGQPVPLFVGPLLPQEAQQWVDELLKLAVQHGVTGRVSVQPDGASPDAEGADPGDAQREPELPPLHQAAFDAIDRGDLDGAVAAYEQALKEAPADAEAKAGLAQVRLMKRTEGLDVQAARQEAAAAPTDVDAQLRVADLDVLGGHVEDAFTRLIDAVRVTEGEDRTRIREHLLELFEIVGTSDERVVRARKALMSALF